MVSEEARGGAGCGMSLHSAEEHSGDVCEQRNLDGCRD